MALCLDFDTVAEGHALSGALESSDIAIGEYMAALVATLSAVRLRILWYALHLISRRGGDSRLKDRAEFMLWAHCPA